MPNTDDQLAPGDHGLGQPTITPNDNGITARITLETATSHLILAPIQIPWHTAAAIHEALGDALPSWPQWLGGHRH